MKGEYMGNQTNFEALERMTDEEAYANAVSDPDCQPIEIFRPIKLDQDDGATVIERFRRAVRKEKDGN
ncbi:MAG: hypothetical protein K6G15_07730 [Desulfovibrio sp.]|nr:hypothetical protein [Desulfovibrio sp.]